MKQLFLFYSLFIVQFICYSQEYFPENGEIHHAKKQKIALTNLILINQEFKETPSTTILIEGNKIVGIGKNISIPKDYVIRDLEGKYIFPSFIDLYSNHHIKKAAKASGRLFYDTKKKDRYWNEHILPEYNSAQDLKWNEGKASLLRKFGFGTINTHRENGMAQGTGMVLALNNDGSNLLKEKATTHYAFKRSASSYQMYPSSLMGMIATLDQMYYDKEWYKKTTDKRVDISLQAILENEALPTIFNTSEVHDLFRANAFAEKHQVNYIYKTIGDSYKALKEVKALGNTLIVPINFPKPYHFETIDEEKYLDLAKMKHWEAAPFNLALLEKEGIPFVITSTGVENSKDFEKNIQLAIHNGLSKERAFKALTSIPAKILALENSIGILQKNAFANFIISEKPPFSEGQILYQNWVLGKEYTLKDIESQSVSGKYRFNLAKNNYTLILKEKQNTIQGNLKQDTTALKTTITKTTNGLLLNFMDKDSSFVRVQATIKEKESWPLIAQYTSGKTLTSSLKKEVDTNTKKTKKSTNKSTETPSIYYPNASFGSKTIPESETILFKNATVWTNEKDGILLETDVLVRNGLIEKIGKNLKHPNAKTIDATGKHLTSGIVDEHSHIAIKRGVNEAGHNSTAEVSIAHVVDPEDVNIYRNLAGGVTTVQLLHGSANPIGGRSAIIKLKWGALANELLIKDQPKFIKFALGENVKQSNWGNGTRFPQTRMGVEQIITNYFDRAKAYEKNKKTGDFRFDIEMETLVEIMNKERFITCHSYVQSEILMLMQVAEKFAFNVNTFTHILEGYKVAEEMKAHGVAASTFSDWWAYKFEVNDAIPYNAAILHKQGIVVGINSDDAEMSRRLNQEAAKAVKYGNVSEEDAWKFVTLNPAKMLHLDDKIGSIKKGKQADIVLWSDNPLSIYAQADLTMIEGAIYFDKEKNKRLEAYNRKEKNRLSQKMMLAKAKGIKTQAIKKEKKVLYHCDTHTTEN